MKTTNQYTVINASAGSGKTYSLVQSILVLCLKQDKYHDTIRQILALTFTNKAANEMKVRILEWLKDFTKEDYETNKNLQNIREKLKTLGINATMLQLHERSQKVLDYILHHYSTLNIGTIDKFNARLVRSFSYELGLPHQFNLEIQNEPYLIEAVDKMLNEVGENEQISEAFMDFINYNLDNDERINLSNSLYKKAKHFINDVHYDELKNNSDFDWKAYETTKEQLRKEIATHKKTAIDLAQSTLKLIEDNGLKEDDFQGKSNGIAAWFKKYLKFEKKSGEKFPFSGKEENYRKLTTSKEVLIIQAIEGIIETLIENRICIIQHYIAREKKNKILTEILPLKINKEIQDKLSEIEEENDLVLLSKFNIIINENLKNEPSNFIYEKIGTKFQHFFIDEFQDTSKMQWQNILPLRDHTITSEGNSFSIVGDPKQSIYRFRGGDSELMINIINHEEQSPIQASVNKLEYNWRSAANIVNFNNELYEFISKNLKPNHRKLFSEQGKQIAKQNFSGRVKINFSEYTRNNEEYYEEVSEQMYRNIQECVDNGFRFKDITILCRTAKEIQKYAQLLGRKKVNENYIKTISEKGLTLDLSYTLKALIEFLNWKIQPKNRQFLVKMLYFLNELGRIHIDNFSETIIPLLNIKNTDELTRSIEQQFHLKLNTQHISQLNLYNEIEFLIQEFSVKDKETDFILNFLEILYNFTQNLGLSLKDFVKYWDEEAHSISIQANANINAINMMTIHAAKGLEFPVVFLPMKNSHKDSNFSEWLGMEDYDKLKSVSIKNFNKDFETYDESIAHFNQENSYKNTIDRLCVQYVATTRPVEQLFLYIQKPNQSSNYLEIYDFVQTLNPNHLDEFDLYQEINDSYKKCKKSSENMKQNTSLKISFSSDKPEHYNNIKIATPSRNYQNTKESVRIGIFVHEILAKIHTEKDVEKAIQNYTLEGIITHEEQQYITERIYNVLKNPQFATYFTENNTIINEKEIMISENGKSEIYRPDRLILSKDGYIIIDFKTGTEHEKHEKQLQTYRRALESIGKKIVKTEIIYI